MCGTKEELRNRLGDIDAGYFAGEYGMDLTNGHGHRILLLSGLLAYQPLSKERRPGTGHLKSPTHPGPCWWTAGSASLARP